MKILIAGGSGYLGKILTNHFKKDPKNQIYILSRKQQLDTENIHFLTWDATTKGY